MNARHEELSKATVEDWTPGKMTPEHQTPIFKDAMSRLPKPSDAVNGSPEHFGVHNVPDANAVQQKDRKRQA